MDQRIYHGNISPSDFSRALVGRFNQGNLRVQQFGDAQKITLQIATSERARSGGQTAITIQLQAVEDGVSVQVGEQGWLGTAASLGVTAISALLNPVNLLNRLDDIAQDVENLQLKDEVWKMLDSTARMLGATTELSDRLKRMVCQYCTTANPVGQPRCIACGAPLGDAQPLTCRKCGFVVYRGEVVCPVCKSPL